MLTQIIFEQENKGTNLLPINFLRQVIRFYGDSMQLLLPRYLDASMDNFTRDQDKFREQMSKAFGVPGFGMMEEQVRRNMEMFQQSLNMFARDPQAAQRRGAETSAESKDEEIRSLKRQLEDLQKRLDAISPKAPGGDI